MAARPRGSRGVSRTRGPCSFGGAVPPGLKADGAPRADVSVHVPSVASRPYALGPPLRRGQLVHKYRIEKRIGEGRFATVYQAYDRIEGVRVALKVFAQHPAVSSVFAHEARIATRLGHENIVRLKTAEILGGRRVLVSELGD